MKKKLKWEFNQKYKSLHTIENGLSTGYNIQLNDEKYELYQRFKWYVGSFTNIKKAKHVAQLIHEG